MGKWPLLVADFASEYGIRLHAERFTMPFGEFVDYVAGLLCADTRTYRHFHTAKG